MHDRVSAAERGIERLGVEDRALDQFGVDAPEIVLRAGREVVERDDVVAGRGERAAEVGADESCAAGDDHPHGCAGLMGVKGTVVRWTACSCRLPTSEPPSALLLDAFDSNWIAPLGPHVDAFEREFAELRRRAARRRAVERHRRAAPRAR